jgi:hypothetical protein
VDFYCISNFVSPFEKIALGRSMWNIIDVVASLFLAGYNFTKKEINKKNIE